MYRFVRETQISKVSVLILALAAAAAIGVVEHSKEKIHLPYYEARHQAVLLARHMMRVLKRERLARGIRINPIDDPRASGMIGVDDELSVITTHEGDLGAKQISTNPEFAAIIVDQLTRAGLKKGDAIAITWTGSYPALNVSVLAAVRALRLKPLILTSLGSSGWGANIPSWTWLDMEKYLYDRHLISVRSAAAIVGGAENVKWGLSADRWRLLRQAAARNGIPLLDEDHLEDHLQKRIAVLRAGDPSAPLVEAYVRIGGGFSNLPPSRLLAILPTGVPRRALKKGWGFESWPLLFGRRGIPVINLCNVRELAENYRLVKSTVWPPVTQFNLFTAVRYSIKATLAATLLLILVCLIVIRYDLRSMVKRASVHNIMWRRGNEPIPPLGVPPAETALAIQTQPTKDQELSN